MRAHSPPRAHYPHRGTWSSPRLDTPLGDLRRIVDSSSDILGPFWGPRAFCTLLLFRPLLDLSRIILRAILFSPPTLPDRENLRAAPSSRGSTGNFRPRLSRVSPFTRPLADRPRKRINWPAPSVLFHLFISSTASSQGAISQPDRALCLALGYSATVRVGSSGECLQALIKWTVHRPLVHSHHSILFIKTRS